MTKEDFTELIHKDIDGLIQPDEKAQLGDYFMNHPNARKEYDELIKTTKLLKHVDEIETPSHLTSQIMNSVNPNLYAPKIKESPFKQFFANLLPESTPKLALVFATGLVVGIFLYSLFSSSPAQKALINNEDLVGTIGFNQSVEFREIKTIPVQLDELKGTIHLKQYKNFVLFEVSLAIQESYTLTLEFDDLSFGFASLRPATGTRLEFENKAGLIRVIHSENSIYQILLTQTSSQKPSIKLNILKGVQVYFIQNLTLPSTE
jgi:hypothetical protein